jgi:hypothetical protein
MPYTRRPNRRKRRAPARKKFVPRGLAAKRAQALDTKVFYFKTNGVGQTDQAGQMFQKWNSRAVTQTPGAFPQFQAVSAIYDQFKVLAIRVRFYPANVGVESHDTLIGTDLTLIRGNTINWLDQRADDLFAPSSIAEVINDASMRMVNSRRPFSRTIFRGRGFPEWGAIQNTALNDSWNGSISVLTVDASPAPITGPAPTLYYWTANYKVIFRARRT